MHTHVYTYIPTQPTHICMFTITCCWSGITFITLGFKVFLESEKNHYLDVNTNSLSLIGIRLFLISYLNEIYVYPSRSMYKRYGQSLNKTLLFYAHTFWPNTTYNFVYAQAFETNLCRCNTLSGHSYRIS